MKLFSYLLVACAGLGLFACNTEDEVPTIDTGKTKSVALKLDGISGTVNTKAIEDGTTSGSTIILKDMRILFCGADGSIYKFYDYAYSTVLGSDWVKLFEPAGLVFHNIDRNVTKIMIVGNKDNKGINWATVDNVSDIKTATMLAAEENQSVADFTTPDPINSTKNYVTLWGESALGDKLTAGLFDGTHPDADQYKVAIKLDPLVARFEIGNIQCDDLGTHFSEIKLKGIGLVDMSLSKVFDGTLSPRLLVNTFIVAPGVTPSGSLYEFGSATALAWAYNAIPTPPLTENPLLDSNGDIYNYNTVGSSLATTGKFVYNFFPDPVGFPNIRLQLTGVKTKLGVTSTFDFVCTTGFTSTEILTDHPKAGHIYTINYKFHEANIGYWDDVICVDISVTVANWTIMALTPTFK